jgi:hypothetical protein
MHRVLLATIKGKLYAQHIERVLEISKRRMRPEVWKTGGNFA